MGAPPRLKHDVVLEYVQESTQSLVTLGRWTERLLTSQLLPRPRAAHPRSVAAVIRVVVVTTTTTASGGGGGGGSSFRSVRSAATAVDVDGDATAREQTSFFRTPGLCRQFFSILTVPPRSRRRRRGVRGYDSIPRGGVGGGSKRLGCPGGGSRSRAAAQRPGSSYHSLLVHSLNLRGAKLKYTRGGLCDNTIRSAIGGGESLEPDEQTSDGGGWRIAAVR